MKRLVLAFAAATAMLASPARSADLLVIASNAVKPSLDELAPAFERASGHKVSLKYGVAAVMTREIASGVPFDLGIVTNGGIADLIKQGKVAAGSQTPIARSGKPQCLAAVLYLSICSAPAPRTRRSARCYVGRVCNGAAVQRPVRQVDRGAAEYRST